MTKTVANFLIDHLVAHGIDQLYCLPGVQNDHFFDALYDRTGEVTPIHTRHEQGAAYMALGASLATGKKQAYCVVPGPGFLNTTAALSTAYAVNAPVMAIAGQIPSGAMGKGFGLLHEIEDQIGTMRGLTKEAHQIFNGKDAADFIPQAFAQVDNGRPRPVGMEIPVNVWRQELPDGTVLGKRGETTRPEVDVDKIKAAAKLLSTAHNPMIIVGGGAQNFSREVIQLAEALSAPVCSFRNGRGIIPTDHPLAASTPVAHALWSKVDVVIGLGSRMQSQRMQWGTDEGLKVIHIDVDETELNRVKTPTVGIHGDLVDALPLLLKEIEGKEWKNEDWLATVQEVKAQREALINDQLAPQLSWLNAIRAELPREGLFVDELTQVGYVSRFAFQCYQPRTFLSTGFQGTLGYGFATALGAAHARRDVPVVAIAGDGGALFTLNEMATAVRHSIPLTTIVFNDNAFGNVRTLQREWYDERYIASDLTSPDFVKLAEAFGARGMKATTPEELRSCLKQSFKDPAPTLIEVPVGEFPSPWEFVLQPQVRGATNQGAKVF